MLGLGNTAANRIWEANLLPSIPKPSPTSGHEEKEKFIRAKYETKQFLAPLPASVKGLESQIVEAVTKMDIKLLALLLAHLSVQAKSLSAVESATDRKTPLHFASKLGCLEITQLLLWVSYSLFFSLISHLTRLFSIPKQYNINEKAVDTEGKTALFYARVNGHREIEELLILSGCTMTTVDSKLSTPGQDDKAGRRDSLQLHMKSMDQFNKLHTSII